MSDCPHLDAVLVDGRCYYCCKLVSHLLRNADGLQQQVELRDLDAKAAALPSLAGGLMRRRNRQAAELLVR